MALALGWTLHEVLEHSPVELTAMARAMEERQRLQKRAAAHRRARR